MLGCWEDGVIICLPGLRRRGNIGAQLDENLIDVYFWYCMPRCAKDQQERFVDVRKRGQGGSKRGCIVSHDTSP